MTPTRARRTRRAVVVLILVIVGLGGGARPAQAHASLRSVDPPDGARLEESPSAVTLTFTEPVTAELGGVRVLDERGARVDAGAVVVDGTVVTLDLQPSLADGTYVITYRVVSADGHPVRGGSVFAVGVDVDVDALGRVTEDDDRRWEILGGVGRGIAYAGVLLAAGGALFLVTVHRNGPERPRLVHLVRTAALVGGIAALVALPVQAALATGRGAGALFEEGLLADVAAEGVGHSLLLALVGLTLLVAGITRSTPAALVGAGVAAGSFAATGHNRAGDTALLATLADVVHLAAAAAWAGGLVLLWVTLRQRRATGADPVQSAHIVARFSRLATVGILAVGAAGAALGWSEVRALDALTSTSYGLFLVGKVAMVAAIAILGAYNHFRLVPTLEQGSAGTALVRLHQMVRVEAAILVGVLALTSVLVVMTPAKASTGSTVVERIVDLEEAGSVQLVVSPARTGVNDLHLYTYDPDGRPADIAQALTLELTLPTAGVGPLDLEAVRAGPAHFQLTTSDLAVAGTWEVTVRARIDRFTEATATTTVPIAR